MPKRSSFWSRRSHQGAGFTIIELLVVISIISLLIAILLPALQAGRYAAQDLKCRTNLRAVSMQFMTFADPNSGLPRGDSEALGPRIFRLDDFQESIYRISEFWDAGADKRLSVSPNSQPLMCPSGSRQLERRSGIPCDTGAVGPMANISIGFNMRLRMASKTVNDVFLATNAYLTDKVLQFPDTPLLLDVEGGDAIAKGVTPYYTAPPVPCPKKKSGEPTEDLFSSGRFWFPGARHQGRLNVGFIGGHVLSSQTPLLEPWWRWEYTPDPL